MALPGRDMGKFAFSLSSNPGGAHECNMMGRFPFFKNLHDLFKKKITIPCLGIIRLQNFQKTIRKTMAFCIVLEQIVIICLGIFYQSVYIQFRNSG